MTGDAGGPAPGEIALFPLKTVLFPGGPLELRIFEPRYIDMVRASLKTESEFGVLSIRSGAEVGPADTADVGTSARIIDFHALPEGLLGIRCRGIRRFRLHSRRQQRDGLNLGTAEWLTGAPALAVPARFDRLVRLLATLLPELGVLYEGIEHKLDDASWVGYRLAEILPLPLGERQRCLEFDDPLERLELLDVFSAGVGPQTPGRDA